MRNIKAYSKHITGSKTLNMSLACSLLTLVAGGLINAGIACSSSPQTVRQEKKEKIAFKVEILKPQQPTAQEALERGRISDAILIYKFEYLHGRIDEKGLASAFKDIESTIGRPGFCRELALAFSSAERVQANHLNERALESADLAGRAVKELQQRYTRRNCKHYWFNTAEILEQNKDYDQAVLWYFLAAEYLEISREKLVSVLNAISQRNSRLSLCDLLKTALKHAASRRKEELEKKGRYDASMLRLAAENIETLMEVEKCQNHTE